MKVVPNQSIDEDSDRGGRWRDGLVVVPLVLVFFYHVWIISAGWMWSAPWPTYLKYPGVQVGYHALLSDAFLHRQCSLLVTPDPRLLALPDPYDPQANIDFRLHDAVLYQGKYYMYWGPVPAILLMPLRAAWPAYNVTDPQLVLVFTQGSMIVTTLLLIRLRRRFFPEGSRFVLLAGVVVAGTIMPMPYILARAAVYEASIMAGQFFLLTGIYAIFLAFDGVSRIKSIAGLSFAGLCLALAVGCRQSLAVAVFALFIAVAFRLGKRAALTHLAALSLPLAAGAVLLGVYNHVRFGSWSQSGQFFQLAGVPLQKIGTLFSVQHVMPGLYAYLLRPWQTILSFPGLRALSDLSMPRWMAIPPGYHTDGVTGILITSPVLVFAIVPALSLIRARWSPGNVIPATSRRSFNWFMACLLLAGVLGFAPVLLLVGCTMRYFADLVPSLVIAATVGFWQVDRMLAQRARLRFDVRGLAVIAAGYAALIALMLSISGSEDHFLTHNLALYSRMASCFGM
jgi:hypothetical protein